jgi:NAD(P)-dependent dehydrogenase (short-subunit alcohol dehydrogenase family)
MENNKVWFITGANRGIGAEIARTVLNAGHKVVATARKPETIAALLGHSDRLLAVPLDVTKPEQAEAAVAAAKQKFGRIDILVNNAGYGQLGWFENTSDKQVRDQFETNVFGTMQVTRAVLPIMRAQRSGHVLTISSIAGFIAFPGSSVYSASKFAVEGWMEGLAQELKPLGIAATIIEPGFFKTDFLDNTSVNYGEYNITDYEEQSSQFKDWHDNMNHNQVGDPAKLGAVLIRLSEMEVPPLNFPAGSDAVDMAFQTTERFRLEVEQNKELSASTDSQSRNQ